MKLTLKSLVENDGLWSTRTLVDSTLSQLAPFDSMVNSHLYRTQVNLHLGIFHTFSSIRQN